MNEKEQSEERRGQGHKPMLISLQISSPTEPLVPSAHFKYSVGIFKSTKPCNFWLIILVQHN